MEVQSTSHSDQNESFRTYLQNELIRRCKDNNAYSLRSFAKSLSVNHAALSQILRCKRSLTTKMVRRLSLELGLTPEQITEFLSQKTAIENYDAILSVDEFYIISDWYHLALLELLKIRNSNDDRKWLAKTLSISISEVNISIERLLRLKILIIKDDKLLETGESIGYTNCLHPKITNNAKRNFQKQTFEKAIASLENDELTKRSHSGVTMAIDSSRIEGANIIISKFRRELMNYLEGGDNIDEVYQLSIGLFPLTNLNDLNELKTGEEK